MKRFFYQTYYFWLITRILFIFGAILDSDRMFSEGLDELDLFINYSIIGYIGLMIYNTFNEYRNTMFSKVTKYIVGVLSLILGLVIIIVVGTHPSSSGIALAIPLVTWIILLGIFDLSILNRYEEMQEEIELG